ncbi:MAG: hypothetical protein ACTHLN_08155 [Tepidisphaeraceae bacterium]
MTDAPETPSSSPSVASNPELGHLSRLHRMSRTAGLGSSDYTAVNTASVIAVLLGAGSAMALMTPIFLILPVIGLVIAGLAIAQIRRSNGTQTGLALAILGLLLCLGFAASTGFKAYKQNQEREHDIATLKDLIHQFGQDLAEQKYADAYNLADDRFHEQVPLARFQTFFTEMQAAPPVGAIDSFESNGIFGIEQDPETDAKLAVGITLVSTKRLNGEHALRTEFRYRNDNGDWKIYAIPDWFAPKAAPGQSTAAGAASGALQGPAGPPSPR